MGMLQTRFAIQGKDVLYNFSEVLRVNHNIY